ncbi:MAG: hypothetical protein L0323_14525 [Planctomycetes bacterium]|nr:hypothetical protein [Planctomycetota bacterium]
MRIAMFFPMVAALLVAPARGQCTVGTAGLTVTPDTPVVPGSQITVSVTGNPGAYVLVFRGPNPGATTLPGFFGGATICLDSPFLPIPIGSIPSSGTKTVQLPTNPNAAAGTSYTYQAVTLSYSGGLNVDTSGTDSITFSSPGPPPPCNPGALGLTVTPDVPVQPGDTIVRTVTGPPDTYVFLAFGQNLGSTTIPYINLNLCLGFPFGVSFMGEIPASGTLTKQNTIPPSATLPGNVTVSIQAFSVSYSGGFSFDTSNLDSLVF